MPSVFSHPAVPLALTTALPPEMTSASVVVLGVACSVIPDLDVVGFRFGVPRGHVLSHRGLSHSIAFAVFLSACLAWVLPSAVSPSQGSRVIAFIFFSLSTLSHGLLDAMTNGGSGVAFFAPLHNARYFLPWRPLLVSPISVGRFFSARGLDVLRSEWHWVWLPAAAMAVLLYSLRRLGS